jgi:hypothetical protein
VTDSPVGREFCAAKLGVTAHNALRDGAGLAQSVLGRLAARGLVPGRALARAALDAELVLALGAAGARS